MNNYWTIIFKVAMEKGFILLVLPLLLCGCKKDNNNVFTEYYNNKVALFIEENKTLGPVDVCVIGDSLTDLCDFNIYYPDLKIANRGIGGDTTTGVLNRLDCSLIDVDMKVVSLFIGINNSNTMFNDYEDILKALSQFKPNAAKVILSLTPTTNDFEGLNDTVNSNNIRIKQLAESYLYTYVDINTPLKDEKGHLKQEYTTDGLHFSDEGYKKIASVVDPIYKSFL